VDHSTASRRLGDQRAYNRQGHLSVSFGRWLAIGPSNLAGEALSVFLISALVMDTGDRPRRSPDPHWHDQSSLTAGADWVSADEKPISLNTK
jgi:hypothetical protein